MALEPGEHLGVLGGGAGVSEVDACLADVEAYLEAFVHGYGCEVALDEVLGAVEVGKLAGGFPVEEAHGLALATVAEEKGVLVVDAVVVFVPDDAGNAVGGAFLDVRPLVVEDSLALVLAEVGAGVVVVGGEGVVGGVVAHAALGGAGVVESVDYGGGHVADGVWVVVVSDDGEGYEAGVVAGVLAVDVDVALDAYVVFAHALNAAACFCHHGDGGLVELLELDFVADFPFLVGLGSEVFACEGEAYGVVGLVVFVAVVFDVVDFEVVNALFAVSSVENDGACVVGFEGAFAGVVGTAFVDDVVALGVEEVAFVFAAIAFSEGCFGVFPEGEREYFDVLQWDSFVVGDVDVVAQLCVTAEAGEEGECQVCDVSLDTGHFSLYFSNRVQSY